MDKPLTLVLRDTKKDLIKICNNSGLPPVILDLIIQDIAKDISIMAAQQVQREEASYLAALEVSDTEEADSE